MYGRINVDYGGAPNVHVTTFGVGDVALGKEEPIFVSDFRFFGTGARYFPTQLHHVTC